jgi:hypothetical protein
MIFSAQEELPWKDNFTREKANFFKVRNRDSSTSSAIANFIGVPVDRLKIRKFLQICTTLLQNNTKSCFCKMFKHKLESEHYMLFQEEQYVLADFAEVLSPQITKNIGSANRKYAKCHICRIIQVRKFVGLRFAAHPSLNLTRG